MSSEEESDVEEEEVDAPPLDEVQQMFHKKIGHFPHMVKQMLAFCKSEGLPYKYRDINAWWPSRATKVAKPVEKPVNADDYKAEGFVAEESDDDVVDDEPEAKVEAEVEAEAEVEEEVEAEAEAVADESDEDAPVDEKSDDEPPAAASAEEDEEEEEEEAAVEPEAEVEADAAVDDEFEDEDAEGSEEEDSDYQ